MKNPEPACLITGKEFQELIQREWLVPGGAEGEIKCERRVDHANGRRGRMDIFIKGPDSDLLTVVEIKATNWDRISPGNVRRNVRSHVRQVWRYVNSLIVSDDITPCAGI